MGKKNGGFYSLDEILKRRATYNVIFGERSNGKSYAVEKYGLERFWNTGKQIAIVRRWRDDLVGQKGQQVFDALVANGEIERITGGEWRGVHYYAGRWWLCKWDEDGKRICHERPFGYAFSISAMEHDKSLSFPDVQIILFDEFISRNTYINNEFALFMNVVSTIVRRRTDVEIFMLGNTVSKFCPYFGEMGLKHIKKQKPGTIDLYRFGESGLTVAVEYAAVSDAKPSDVYFAFDNPHLKMITDGAWEVALYPHLPQKYRPEDVALQYYIEFDGVILAADVVVLQDGSGTFTYIFPKTTAIRHPDSDIVFTPEYSPRWNYRRKITRPTNALERKLLWYYQTDRVYYQNNDIGETIRAYLKWCETAAE